MSTRRGIILILLLLTINFISATGNYDPSDPNTWSSHDLKEWLAEHRVSYTGIPEKHDLVILVKAHWINIKDQAKSTTEAVENFVTKYLELIKDTIVGTDDHDQSNEFTRQLADQFENIRQYAGLTEEQVELVFDRIKEKLKETKVSNKNLTKALEAIKKSYASAKSQRDILIQDATTKIKTDLSNKGLSQETIDWFKEEINKFGDDVAFSKARIGTQACLVLQGIQEKLTQLNSASAEQIKETIEKLKSTVGDTYQSINENFERLRKELTDTIGGTAENVVEELKSQFSTANDYRLITQEKIQSIIEHIGQKLQDGKTVTVEQLQNVKDSVKRYFDTFKYYYNTATGQTKQMVFETKENREKQFDRIITTIQERINEARKKRDEQLEKVLETIESELAATNQLTKKQANVLSDTIKEQLGNMKYVRDFTEDKAKSFFDLLKTRWTEAKEYAEEGYEAAYNKVSSGYDAGTDKLGKGFDKVKEQLASQKEEL